MIKEIWKDVVGYENLYQVSNFGNVKRKGKTKNLCKSKNNYYGVKLCKNNIKKYMSIHRLVASAFIPNPKSLPQVNHIDGNKFNNYVNNLEWVSQSDNEKHAYLLGLTKPTRISPVIKYDLNGNYIEKYNSIQEAKEKNKLCSKISDCCLGNRKTAGGFIWKYAIKEEK